MEVLGGLPDRSVNGDRSREVTTNVAAEIERLPTLSRQQLLDLWLRQYGSAAPSGVRKSLLVPFLAYHLQEKAYGGLKPSTRAELRRIARAHEKGWDTAGASPRPRIKPGTRIVRQWKGRSIEVSVTESGFEYGGAKYRSLSQIARKITGTRWSGPAFFRLNGPAKNGSRRMSKSAVRCAVYTRKSSEEGLEQSFNSLEAQREACVAYIQSQKHEGWIEA